MMKIFDRINSKKKYIEELELKVNKLDEIVKSSFWGGNGNLFSDVINGNCQINLSVTQSLDFYSTISPMFLAVDRIAKSISELNFKVRDLSTGEFVQHDVLDLLKQPNAVNTATDFKYAMSTYFSATGNAYFVATGSPESAPLEIWNVNPKCVTPLLSDLVYSDIPRAYQVTSTSGRIDRFAATNSLDGAIRYYNAQGSELIHIKQLNPAQSNSCMGMSKALPLLKELEQFAEGNTNNLRLLLNGARPSLAFVNVRKESLTDDQFDRMNDEIKKYSGSNRAGGVPLLDGFDIKEISQNNRDMQFQELRNQMQASIFNLFGVPLALVTENVMTLNNLETAQIQFYDNAVIPQFKLISEQLTRALMYRYPDSEDLQVTFSPAEVEVLRPRALSNATQLDALNVDTMNEIRATVGQEPLENGGDVILGNAGSVVIAESQPVQTKSSKRYFFEKMGEQVDENGVKRYSLDRIAELWERANGSD